MKHTLKQSTVRKIDNNLTITDLFVGKNFNFDFVIASLNGDHPTCINHISDRAYFILEGKGTVIVNGTEYEVTQHDLVTIKANIPHTIKGQLKYVIVTSPPFDPKNEEIVSST